MPTTEEQTRETLKLLASADVDDLALATERQRLNEIIAQTTARTAALPRPPTAAQSAKTAASAQEQSARLEARFRQAPQIIRKIADKYELGPEQEYQSRRDGSLGAVINADLQDEVNKQYDRAIKSGEDIGTNEAYQLALEAQRQFVENEQVFHATNNAIEPGQPLPWEDLTNFGPEQVNELRTNKGLIGSARNVVGGAIGGLVGLGGVAASALGAEETGAALAGAGQNIQDAIGTQDLAGRAAELEFSDIIRKAQSGDIELQDAMLAAGRLAATDIDAFTNLAETIGSAAAGGGPLGLAARGAGAAARATGAVGNAATRVGSAVAPRGTGAAFVGIGQGVDENLTTDQAQILAGTGVIAGQLSRLGSAENLLGNAARRVTPGLSPVTTSAATTTPSSLIGGGVGGALRTAGAESAQEFVEGTGEGLGQAAQEGGSVASAFTGDNLRQAAIGGAVAAPLGAVAGGAIGGIGGVAGARSDNVALTQRQQGEAQAAALEQQQAAEQQAQADAAAAERRDQEALGQAQADQFRADRDARLRSSQGIQELFQQFGERTSPEFNQQRAAEREQFNSTIAQEQTRLNEALTTSRAVVQEPGLDTPIDQIGQLVPQRADFGTMFPALTNDPTSPAETQAENTQRTVEAIREIKALDPEAQELQLRALYRNSFGENLPAENAFIGSFNSQESNTPRTFVNALETAVGASLQTNVEPSTGLDDGAAAQAQVDIDGQTPVTPLTPNAPGTAPGVDEEAIRTQARTAAQSTLNRLVTRVPSGATPSNPISFGAVDIGADGRLRSGVDLNINPADVNRQVNPTANVENTILADGRTVTEVGKGDNQLTAFVTYQLLSEQDPDQLQASLEALGVSSGLDPSAASSFALELGAPSGLVAEYQQRAAAALNRARRLTGQEGQVTPPTATPVDPVAPVAPVEPAPVEPAPPTEPVEPVPSETNQIELSEIFDEIPEGLSLKPGMLDTENGYLNTLLSDRSLPALSGGALAQQRVVDVLSAVNARGSEILTPEEGAEIVDALRQYERATGKKL